VFASQGRVCGVNRRGRKNVNLTLVREGKARVVFYEDRRKLRYESELREAEKQ
jgi:endonuclease YncB( thermonuclease family)